MPGISVKLPLTIDTEDGFALNKTYKASIKQNFKMLLLTSPGERIMLPEFGVGLKRFLFEQSVEDTNNKIKNRIGDQVKKYMPFIEITSLNIITPDGLDKKTINISIKYKILPLDSYDMLEVKVDNPL